MSQVVWRGQRYCGEGRDIGCFEVPDIICYYNRLCLETHVKSSVERAEILVALRFLISCYYNRLCLETHVKSSVERAEILVALRFLISLLL